MLAGNRSMPCSRVASASAVSAGGHFRPDLQVRHDSRQRDPRSLGGGLDALGVLARVEERFGVGEVVGRKPAPTAKRDANDKKDHKRWKR